MCAQFLHEIHSYYIPGLDGKKSVAREANRVWAVALPEETDIFIANKIIDRLRDLLHYKLMQQSATIQMLYHQMKHDKRRMSHGELSSSGEESQKDEEDEDEEEIDSNVSKFLEKQRLRARLRAEAKANPRN